MVFPRSIGKHDLCDGLIGSNCPPATGFVRVSAMQSRHFLDGPHRAATSEAEGVASKGVCDVRTRSDAMMAAPPLPIGRGINPAHAKRSS
jgi:hypothetical protein